jgi:hypothetical protein
VTTHVATATVEQLPIPVASHAPGLFRRIVAAGRSLSRGYDAAAFARLNAHVAALYQLSTPEFEHVLNTFPLVAKDERRDALEAFKRRTDNR